MTDHALDYRLDQADRYTIEDGEAEHRPYCWVCGYYVPIEAMPDVPDMYCAWCENDIRDVDEFMERLDRIEAEHSERHANRVKGVEEAVQRTFDAIFEGG